MKLVGSGGERAVWTFTLRDSPDDFINVTVWGSKEYINSSFKVYKVGTVGKKIKDYLLKKI